MDGVPRVETKKPREGKTVKKGIFLERAI